MGQLLHCFTNLSLVSRKKAHATQHTAISIEGNSSEGGATLLSQAWASAPGCSTSPRCFLPFTAFSRMDGTLVRAAELKQGDILLGLHGRHVQVADITKHSAAERDLVTLCTTESVFRVTADHLVLVEGPRGPEPLQARGLRAASPGMSSGSDVVAHRIFDGNSFHTILQVTPSQEIVPVIELC